MCLIARSGKLTRIALFFLAEDFPHLAGMQYSRDVDFGIRKTEYYGERLMPAFPGKRLEDSKIEESRNWNKISGRLNSTNKQKAINATFCT
ncbi:MAG: hypothetical protein PUJ07_09575 [Eubacteriales bacterium]|nr:hypothetical protein [Eubacteriales bacterium]